MARLNCQGTISIEDEEELADCYLPNAMVQAFVENAIIHGLKPKKGNKQLAIRFYADEDFLFVEIEDNGIGRIKAAARKSSWILEATILFM